MKKTIVCILSLLIAASLTGCDKGPKKDVREGARDEVQIPGTGTTIGAKLPGDLPAYVEIYPGSEVSSVVSNMGDGQVKGIITLRVRAGIQDVVAFYRQAAEKNGLKVKGEFSTETVHTLNAGDGDKVVGVIATAGDGGEVVVQLTYK